MLPTPPDNPAPELAAAATRLGVRDVSVMRRSGKTLLAAGRLGSRPVVVKLLLDGDDARWSRAISTAPGYPRKSGACSM